MTPLRISALSKPTNSAINTKIAAPSTAQIAETGEKITVMKNKSIDESTPPTKNTCPNVIKVASITSVGLIWSPSLKCNEPPFIKSGYNINSRTIRKNTEKLYGSVKKGSLVLFENQKPSRLMITILKYDNKQTSMMKTI